MNDLDQFILPISVVERETGLTKDTLRKWETRYGFPAPNRDAMGERLYAPSDVERLRLIKLLINGGARPVQVVGLAEGALRDLLHARSTMPGGVALSNTVESMLELLRSNAMDGLRAALRQDLLRQGLAGFVQSTCTHLLAQVGQAWQNGSLSVYQEHAFSELFRSFMLDAIAAVSQPGEKVGVLLTTPPGEQHGLGLLLVHALFALGGFRCLPLGTQTPLQEIAKASAAYQADIVILSLSMSYPKRQVIPTLTELRMQIPQSVQIWVGGAGVQSNKLRVAGVRHVASLEELAGLISKGCG